jgi:DNA repair exonuclease SbcCD nuclease subunit
VRVLPRAMAACLMPATRVVLTLASASVVRFRYRSVNFEDPHYNVQLPVFSIHGNHDDPAGDGGLAALDLLSTANLINYFGRADNFEKITLSPVLIQKGKTKLALYGLGHVRDERLNRCFERKEASGFRHSNRVFAHHRETACH